MTLGFRKISLKSHGIAKVTDCETVTMQWLACAGVTAWAGVT